jgi:nucleotide sugar dehydrogenase
MNYIGMLFSSALMDYENQLKQDILNRKARVGVVGVGYVGSALALGAVSGGFEVLGFARSKGSVQKVSELGNSHFLASNNFADLSGRDIICICVPTPLKNGDTPDFSMFRTALATIAKYLHPGCLVIIESSIPPGTTRNLALPILLGSGLILEKDFFLGFSPERIDPGNGTYTINNTPKIVSGIGPGSRNLIHEFYATFVQRVIDVSSPESAELTKFFENTFRFVNIGLSNEFATLARKLNINFWEVIDAAASKPFGFMPHYPGPGIGGDCIPVLPRYLLSTAKKNRVSMPIVKAAVKTDVRISKQVTRSVLKLLNGKRKTQILPKVLMVGISYKANVGDLRESPALRIWDQLSRKGISVNYHDPYIPIYNGSTSCSLTPEVIGKFDAIVITTPHRNVSYDTLVSSGIPILDTRNVLAAYSSSQIVRL